MAISSHSCHRVGKAAARIPSTGTLLCGLRSRAFWCKSGVHLLFVLAVISLSVQTSSELSAREFHERTFLVPIPISIFDQLSVFEVLFSNHLTRFGWLLSTPFTTNNSLPDIRSCAFVFDPPASPVAERPRRNTRSKPHHSSQS